MTAEPVAQPLVGFRRWGSRKGGLYSGIFVAGRFVPNPALTLIAPRTPPSPWPTERAGPARCHAVRGHEAPSRDCRCGFSGYYTLPEEPDLPAPEAVWGAVVAWGRIVECEHGFRAQYVRPVALLDCENPLDRRKTRRVVRAAESYEIPLLERDELIAYAGWHGELCC
ncbi:MAG TPA: hypothetical protein VGV40_02780 [Solirubrobacteraceae bacterium]|nr:hypothetical protein [Solirubrobacteraceae bacterium]